MIHSQENGWLVPLADLSLILFVVTGVTLANTLAAKNEPPVSTFTQAAPASVHVDSADGPTLSGWLQRYQHDPGGQLTIHGRYSAGARASVVTRANLLAQEAMAAGMEPRLIIEPGLRSQVLALFAYDRDPQVAQSLLQQEQH